MLKRTLSFLLCLIMVLGLATPAVQASDDVSTSDNIMDNIVIEDGANVNVVVDGNNVATSQGAKLPNPADLMTKEEDLPYVMGAAVEEEPTLPQSCECADLASAVEHGGICLVKTPYMQACEVTAGELFALWGSYTPAEQAFMLSYLEDAFPLKHYELEKLLNAPTGTASETLTDGTTVSVEGIPQDGSLTVGDATDEVQQIVDAYVAEKEETSTPLFGYDVSVQDGEGADWQPETNVKMELELPGEKLHKNTKVFVVHVDDDGVATTIEATVTEDGKIAFETPGFSAFYGFTVDFDYEGVTFSIKGMSSIKLSELIDSLKMPLNAQDVTNLTFTNDEYIRIEKLEGDWELFSLKEFSTTEALTLTMNDGEVYEITVTDDAVGHAQIFKASGTGTTVDEWNWDTDGDGTVTWNATGNGDGLSNSPGWTRQGRIEIRGPGTMTIRIANGGNNTAETLYVDLFQFYVTGGAQVTIECDDTFTSSNKRVVFRSSAHDVKINNGKYKGYALFWVQKGILNINPRGQYAPQHMDFVIGGNDSYEYPVRETIENSPVYANNPLILLDQGATALTVQHTEFMHAAAGAIGSNGKSVPSSVQMYLEGCTFYKSVYNARSYTGGAVQHYQTGSGGSFTAKNCWFKGNKNTKSHGGAIAVHGQGLGAVTIQNCTFEDCEISANAEGGGLCIAQGQYQSVKVENCTFDHCVTPGYGGGMSMRAVTVDGDVEILNCTFRKCLAGRLSPNAYLNKDGSVDKSQANIEKWAAKDNADLAGLDKLNGVNGCGAMILGGTIRGTLVIKGESDNPMLIENCLTWNNGGAICLTDDLKVTGTKDSTGKVTEAVTIQYLNINKCFARDSGSAIYLSSAIIPLLKIDHCTIQNCGYFDPNDPNFPESLVELGEDKWYVCQDVYDLSKPNGDGTYKVDATKTERVKAEQLARWKDYTIAQLSPGTDYSGTIRTVGNTACAAQITNCEIMNNRSYSHGGAVYWNAGRIVYKDEATKNEVLVAASLTITNTKMHHNYARNNGGAIFCEGNATIESCEIYNNTADVAGGGVAQSIYTNASRQLGASGPGEKSMLILQAATGGEPVKIYNNTAKNGGGIAITVDYTASYPHTIKSGTPAGKENEQKYWEFSKNFTYEVTFKLGGTHVYGNRALRNGGGVYYDVAYYKDRTDKPEDEVSWEERQRQVDSYIKNVQIDEGLIYSNIAGYSTTAVQVTDASTLKAGDLVVVAAKDYDYAMSTGANIAQNEPAYQIRQQTALVKDSAGRMIVSDTTAVLTLVKGTEEGTFALRLPDGQYLRAGYNHRFKVEPALVDSCNFTLNVDSTTRAASIVPSSSYNGNAVRYNATTGEFSHYPQSEQSDVVLYRLESGSDDIGGNGGGVYVNSNQVNTEKTIDANEKTGSSTVAITGGSIYKNGAYIGNGGGVYLTGVNALCTIRGETTTIGAQYRGETSDGKVNLSTDGGNLATNRRIATNNYVGGCGGGIAIFGGARIEMEGGHIVNNEASTAGGAVAVHGEKSTMYLHHGYIDGNESSMGGGISLNGAKGNSSATDEKYKYGMFFDGGIVRNNTAVKNVDGIAYGGGICISNSATMKFAGGEVSGNKAATSGNSTIYADNQEGGGVAVCMKSTMTITGGRITSNRAYDGGGMVVRGGSTVNMSGVLSLYTKADETADQAKPESERLGIQEGDVNLEDSTGIIAGNIAWRRGGGAYIVSSSDHFTMNNGAINANMCLNAQTVGDTYSGADSCKGGGVFCNSGSFTLGNGHIDDNKAADGGGIYGNYSTVTINNGRLLRNLVRRNGGAIYSDYSTVNVTGGEFTRNKSIGDGISDPGNGGAIFSYGTSNNPSTVTITGGEFYYNTTTTTKTNRATGGAVSVKGISSFSVSDATFKYNTTSYDGGALYCSAPSCTITSGIFEGNTALGSGGAFYAMYANVNILGGTFTNNAAKYGGGMMVEVCTVVIEGGTFQENISNRGGGMYAKTCPTVTISNLKILNNHCRADDRIPSDYYKFGGGLYIEATDTGNCYVTINTGEFSGNTAPKAGGIMVYYSSSSGNNTASLTINGGTISENKALSGNGGGIYVLSENLNAQANMTMNGGRISKNTAAGNGGGVFADNGVNVRISTGTSKNGETTYGEITENTANNGGGVFVTGGADLTVIGGYITYNNATAPAGSSGLKTGYHQNTGLYGTGGGICVTQGETNALSTFTLQAPEGTKEMAIYGNMATFSADDVFSNGKNTRLQVPSVAQMNLSGYGFAPEGWFEDYNTADTKYLSGINSQNTKDDKFVSKRYRNAVGKDRLRIDEERVGSYVNQENAYVAMTLGLPAAVDDTVVIDFTGPVDINLYKNDLCISKDEFGLNNSWLMNELPEPDGEEVTNKNYVYTSKGSEPVGEKSQDLQPRAIANVWNGNGASNPGIITYSPQWSSLSFTKEDTFGYVVVHNNYCYYAKVTVIPATTLYFEDNNGCYYSNGTLHLLNPIITYHTGGNLAEWKPTYNVLSSQDQDRPGSADEDLQVPDADSVYGYDSHYASTTTHSNGSVSHVKVSANSPARATFTFTGTGFDIISLCNSKTTAVMVNVFEGAGNIDFDSAMPLATYFVDTWYQAGETLYQVPVIKVDMTKVQQSEWDPTIPQYDENGNLIGHGDYQFWYRDYGYGTYTVEIFVSTSWFNPQATDFYLDAIRVYNPSGVYCKSVVKENGKPVDGTENVLRYDIEGNPVKDASGNSLYAKRYIQEIKNGKPLYDKNGMPVYRIQKNNQGEPIYTNEKFVDGSPIPAYEFEYIKAYKMKAVENKVIEDAYLADNEGWPVYQELRDMFISANELKNNNAPTDGKILFIDQVQQENESGVVNKVPTISDYKNFGPNNEVYLAPGQAIAFTMNLDDYTNVAGIQVGMRCLNGTGKAQIRNEDDIPLQVLNELGTTDMYYSIRKKYSANKVIIIENTGKTTPIAISNIKITHTAKPVSGQSRMMFKVNRRTAEIALEILSAEQLVESPVVTPKRPALSFNGMVCYNVFFSAKNLGDLTADDLGLAVFSTEDTEGTIETAREVIYGATEIDGLYMTATGGVHAKYLGDKQYFRAFARKSDGTYVYSKMVSYSALDYAKNALAKSSDVKLKQLVVAMLNYGAEAQKFFGYKTDDLMNASLTADDQALLNGYAANSLNAVGKVDASKVGVFVSNRGFTDRKPAISFKGAFEINYFFTPAYAVDGDMKLYFWNEDTYNSVTELTAENADKVEVMTLEDGTYAASSDEIAAKYLDKTVYVAAVYESDGVTYCSGVMPYSIAAYCQKPPAGVQALATAAAIYGCTAKEYFGV